MESDGWWDVVKRDENLVEKNEAYELYACFWGRQHLRLYVLKSLRQTAPIRDAGVFIAVHGNFRLWANNEERFATPHSIFLLDKPFTVMDISGGSSFLFIS